MRIGAELPSLDGATEWLNGGPVEREQLLGSAALVHFWAVSCGSCSEVMPVVNEWREKYSPLGLRIVGVHMPRSVADTDVELVSEAVVEYGLKHPIAVDNQHKITDAFENRYVPSFYIFDGDGHLRHYQAGDRGLKMVEAALERVLGASQSEK